MSSIYLSRFAGYNVIVTGATQGIGFAIAKRFAQEGGNVAFCSRSQENVDAALKELKKYNPKCLGLICNMNRDDERGEFVKKIVDKYGSINTVISNTASNPYVGPMMDIPFDKLDKIIASNLTVHYKFVREVYPHIVRNQNASMTFISSIAAYMATPGIEFYGIAKLGLLGLSRSLAGELARDGIRVNAIVSGVVNTKFSRCMTDVDSAYRVDLSQITTQNRISSPEEIAAVACFLSSEDAKYISGENLVVNGGPLRL